LLHAVSAGLKSDAPQPPDGENPVAGISDFVNGLMHGEAAAQPAAGATTMPNGGAQPAMPATANNPANNAAQPTDDLFGQPATNQAQPAAAQPAMQPPAVPPQTAPPATQTAPATQPPANSNDDPFK
jgi:hypothetical protein